MIVLIISLVYIFKILYLSYIVWGKGNITKLKRVRKNKFATKQNLKKKEKISAKEKKVNQDRDKVTYIKEKEENYKMITAMKKWSSKTKGQTSKL